MNFKPKGRKKPKKKRESGKKISCAYGSTSVSATDSGEHFHQLKEAGHSELRYLCNASIRLKTRIVWKTSERATWGGESIDELKASRAK